MTNPNEIIRKTKEIMKCEFNEKTETAIKIALEKQKQEFIKTIEEILNNWFNKKMFDVFPESDLEELKTKLQEVEELKNGEENE